MGLLFIQSILTFANVTLKHLKNIIIYFRNTL